MGASELDNSKLRKIVHIEAWAQESKTMHTRLCTEKFCGGKSKIWWLVRHPRISPEIASETAKSFAREKYHCCAVLIDELERGVIPWLPKERNLYAARDDDEIKALLGREIAPKEPDTDTAQTLRNPFPKQQRDALPDKRVNRQRHPYDRSPEPVEEVYRKGHRVDSPSSGFGQAIDALKRQ